MPDHIATVPPPAGGLFRIARGPESPFSFADWGRAGADGTFGNRFDDPSGRDGISPDQRFRVLYCATHLAAAFGETMSRFRVDPALRAALARIADDEPLDAAMRGAVDPDFPDHGRLDATWLFRRRIGHVSLPASLRFADVGHASTIQYLNDCFAADVHAYGLDELDVSALTSRHRALTQRVARHLYEMKDASGRPLVAGIRYISRFGANWECWAIFEGRIPDLDSMAARSFPIHADNPDLLDVARIFGLSIETLPESGRYYRPWQDA